MSEPVRPIVNDLNAPFWAAADEGRLLLPVCIATGSAFWPPGPSSPFVSDGTVGWRASNGEGTVRSVVVYRRVFQQAFAAHVPYAIALLELDEGPRLQAFVGDPEASDAPSAGDRAVIRFTSIVDGGPKVPTVALLRSAS